MIIKKIPKLEDVLYDVEHLEELEEYRLLVRLSLEKGHLIQDRRSDHSALLNTKTFLVNSNSSLYKVTITSCEHGCYMPLHSGYKPEVQKVTLKEVISYEVVPCS